MNKLKIGVTIEAEITPNSGGTFSYQQTLARAIDNYQFCNNLDITFVVFYNGKIPSFKFKKPVVYIPALSAVPFKNAIKNNASSFYKQIFKHIPLIKSIYTIFMRSKFKKIEKILLCQHIELLYYLTPYYLSLNLPFITNHLDIGHLSTYPFPELSMNHEYTLRENYYQYTLNKALLIFCESEAGFKELINYKQIFRNKIKVLPIFSSDVVNISVSQDIQQTILIKYHLQKNEFFFYPAQFWSLKNHFNLIQAFNTLLLQHPHKSLKLVLCGADQGNLLYIKDTIKSLSLEFSVILPGFISSIELYSLYSNAAALVMPTFLGPTNMPILEAAILRCPVICSNLDGHKEMMGDFALYVEPHDVNSILQAMGKIIDTNFERDNFCKMAYKHIMNSKFHVEKSLPILEQYFLQIAPIRKAWGLVQN